MDAEFVAGFRVPANTKEAFACGKVSAYHGRPQLSRHEFFKNDVEVRIVNADTPPSGALWRAYKAGRRAGKKWRDKSEAARD